MSISKYAKLHAFVQGMDGLDEFEKVNGLASLGAGRMEDAKVTLAVASCLESTADTLRNLAPRLACSSDLDETSVTDAMRVVSDLAAEVIDAVGAISQDSAAVQSLTMNSDHIWALKEVQDYVQDRPRPESISYHARHVRRIAARVDMVKAVGELCDQTAQQSTPKAVKAKA